MHNVHMILILLSTYLTIQRSSSMTPDVTTTSSSGPTTTGVRIGQYMCIPTTPAPPELQPIDQDAEFLSQCLLNPNDVVQKSGISETTAQQLALCNSFCIESALTRTYPDRKEFQGYPVWTLATQSYLVAPEEGKTTDCLSGDNGCIIDCELFPYFGDPIDPRFSGYRRAQDCKRSCMIKFKSPQKNESDCAWTCYRECLSVGCRCRVMWDGCPYSDFAPPCGLTCNPSDCYFGCGYAESYLTYNPEYPSLANPTQAPELTQIGNGTRYMINITDSIPSDFDSNLGYSTLIVRVQDLSSKTPSDYTYYVLENGFELDLAPFLCQKIAVSFAVATYRSGLSNYSSSVTMDMFSGDFSNLATACGPCLGLLLVYLIFQTLWLFI